MRIRSACLFFAASDGDDKREENGACEPDEIGAAWCARHNKVNGEGLVEIGSGALR